jgi:hypothetical protein
MTGSADIHILNERAGGERKLFRSYTGNDIESFEYQESMFPGGGLSREINGRGRRALMLRSSLSETGHRCPEMDKE